jgi:hypothetical protein
MENQILGDKRKDKSENKQRGNELFEMKME